MPDYSLLSHTGSFNPWGVYSIMQDRIDAMQAKHDEYMDALEELGKDWAQWDARVNPETEGKAREIYEGVMNGVRNEADRLAQHGLDYGMRRRLMDHRLDSTKAMTRISDAWTNRAAMLAEYQKKREADASWMPERDLTLPENYSLDNWLDNPQYNWGHDISANQLATQVSGQIAHIADQLTGTADNRLNGVERMLVEQYGYSPKRVAAEMQRFLADPDAYMANSDGNDLISTAIAATLQGNGVDGDNGNWLSADQRRRLYGQIASIFASTIGKNTASHYTDHAALARLQASLSNPNPSNGGGGGGKKGKEASSKPITFRDVTPFSIPNGAQAGPRFLLELQDKGLVKGRTLKFGAISDKENSALAQKLYRKIGYYDLDLSNYSEEGKRKKAQELFDKYLGTEKNPSRHPDFATQYNLPIYTTKVKDAGNAWKSQLAGSGVHSPVYGESGITVGDLAPKTAVSNHKVVDLMGGRKLTGLQAAPLPGVDSRGRRDVALLTQSSLGNKTESFILNETSLDSHIIEQIKDAVSVAEDCREILDNYEYGNKKAPKVHANGTYQHDSKGNIIFDDSRTLTQDEADEIAGHFVSALYAQDDYTQDLFREVSVAGGK